MPRKSVVTLSEELPVKLVMSPDRHPGTRHFTSLFRYNHLPPRLREVSMKFHELAQWLVDNTPDGPELSVALRKLLEAKDAAVRHVGFAQDPVSDIPGDMAGNSGNSASA
jgi:hypothetical protein